MNTEQATINELLLGLYVNGGKWFDKTAERIYKTKVRKVDALEARLENNRARLMAEEVLEWAKAHKYKLPIKSVYWVAGRGALSAVTGVKLGSYESENPSDILIKFSGGPSGKFEPFLGISSKITHQYKDVQFKNPGIGTVDKELRISLQKIVDDAVKDVIKKFGLSDIQSTREREIKMNKKIMDLLHKLSPEVIEDVRDMLLKKLNSMESGKLKKYLLTDWMDATERFPPYIIVTGRQGGAGFTAHVDDPMKNDKVSGLVKNKVELEKEGYSTIKIKAGGKLIFKIRAKWKDTPFASSFKFVAGY